MLSFTVFGIAQPAGSKRSFVPLNKATGQPFRSKTTGRVVVNTVDANSKSRDWKNAVASAAREVCGEISLLDGPLAVSMRFVLPRPKGHFGSGRNAGTVKASAPTFPAGKPDVLKLARGCEDALTGVVWRDDAQIVSEVLEKHYGEPARVEFEIKEIR
jgi:Holliday junction resolvase RusA-like endonuclease